MGKKSKKRPGGGNGGGGGGNGSSSGGTGRSFLAEAASSNTRVDLPALGEAPPRFARNDANRPTAEIEIKMAEEIAQTLVAQKIDSTSTPLQTDIPNVDLPNVVEQMRTERMLFIERGEAGIATYHDLTRYGVFLKVVRERLAEEHKRGTQRQRVAKALADRSRGEREWSQRSMVLERANALVARLTDAAQVLNTHVSELQASPIFVRAMAELRARDMVKPGWDRTFAPPPRKDDDVEDDISFEDLLRLEKDAGTLTGSFATGGGAADHLSAGSSGTLPSKQRAAVPAAGGSGGQAPSLGIEDRLAGLSMAGADGQN